MQSYLEFLAISINFGAIFDNSPLNSDLAQQYQINKIRNKLLIALKQKVLHPIMLMWLTNKSGSEPAI